MDTLGQRAGLGVSLDILAFGALLCLPFAIMPQVTPIPHVICNGASS